MKLNERIISARKKLGMSQSDLADLLEVSRQTISKWETGESLPEISRLPKLAETLDVSVDWLLSKEENITETEKNETAEYPEWISHLPVSASKMIRKYGWLYGAGMAVNGFLFMAIGLYARHSAYNRLFVFPSQIDGIHIDGYLPGITDPLLQQKWNGISTITAFPVVIGLIVVIAGLVIAILLWRWGKGKTNHPASH